MPYAFTGSFWPRPMYRQTVRSEMPNAVLISGAVSPLSRSSTTRRGLPLSVPLARPLYLPYFLACSMPAA